MNSQRKQGGILRRSLSILGDKAPSPMNTPDDNIDRHALDFKVSAKVEKLKKELGFNSAAFGLLPLLTRLARAYAEFELADKTQPEYKEIRYAAEIADEEKAALIYIKKTYSEVPTKKEEIESYFLKEPTKNEVERVLSYLIAKDFMSLHAMRSGVNDVFHEQLSKLLGFTTEPKVFAPYFKEWAEVNLLRHVTVEGDPEKTNINRMVVKTDRDIQRLKDCITEVLREMQFQKIPPKAQDEIAKRALEKWDPAVKPQDESKRDNGDDSQDFQPRAEASAIQQARVGNGFYRPVPARPAVKHEVSLLLSNRMSQGQ